MAYYSPEPQLLVLPVNSRKDPTCNKSDTMSATAHATTPLSEKPPHEAMGSATAMLDAGKGPGGPGGPPGRPKLEKFAYGCMSS